MRDAARFLLARHTHCIQCGTAKVRRLSRRDRIDRMSRHPLSLVFRLTGAPIVYCGGCRLQYRDWRMPEPSSIRPERPGVAGGPGCDDHPAA